MDMIIETGFSEIFCDIEFGSAIIQKGKALVASDHVQRVKESVTSSMSMIEAFVIRQTSVTSPPYNVQFELNENRRVTSVRCSCVANALGKCKHIYAVIHYINSDRSTSKTSSVPDWGQFSLSQMGKEKYSKGKSISELFPPKLPRQNASVIVPRVFQPKDFGDINCGARNIAIAENTSFEEYEKRVTAEREATKKSEKIREDCVRACVENFILFTENNEIYTQQNSIPANRNLMQFYENFVQLSLTEISDLCWRTTSQSSSAEWFESRKLRITASKAHRVLQLKKKDPETLAQELITAKPFSTKSVEYGLKNEARAGDCYRKLYDVQVFELGIYVCPFQPWLSASVDGVVVQDGCVLKLVEIKCPISCAKLPIYDETTQKCNVKYLEAVNSTIQLKHSHEYYTQCQIQMYVTGLTVCDLFLWSPVGNYVVEVLRNYSFLEEAIPKLEKFYFQFMLPNLCDSSENVQFPCEIGENSYTK